MPTPEQQKTIDHARAGVFDAMADLIDRDENWADEIDYADLVEALRIAAKTLRRVD